MKILITGAKGFIGMHLSVFLKHRGHVTFEYDLDVSKDKLNEFLRESDFIVHLAGINRPLRKEEFFSGNVNFTFELIEFLKGSGRKIPIIFSSSSQALLENDYGISKKMAEDYLFDFHRQTGNEVYVYRLTNLFGKWSRPNYNSVVATYCHNISRGLPIQISNPDSEIVLSYIDDVVNEFVDVIEGKKTLDSTAIQTVLPQYNVTVGKLAFLITSFSESRKSLNVPNLGDDFERKLYATYLSYLDPASFSYDLKMNEDDRGSFSEFLKTANSGQVSVNVTKPGITKGNHYHHTKNEKFLVVSGRATIRFRKVGTEEIITYEVSGKTLIVVDIPPGYTHNITNIGTEDLVTIMWASEAFDKEKPDTFFLGV